MTAQRPFSWVIPNLMSLRYPKSGIWFSLGLAFGIVVFLVAASGALPSAVVHADGIPSCSAGGTSPCTFGPNLEVTIGVFTNPGGDLCVNDSNNAFNTSATNPGYSNTGLCPPVSGPGTVSNSQTLSLAGLNGYESEDISTSINCGVTGTGSASLTIGSLVLNCPSESTTAATGTVSGETTFAPVLDATTTITLSGTGGSDGTFKIIGYSENFSLTPTPEPSTLLLLSTGLLGLLGISRRRLGR